MKVLDLIRPSNTQNQVLALVASATTPKLAGDDISQTSNLIAARNMLVHLGLITFKNGESELTPLGTQIAISDGIVDNNGQLTQKGQNFLDKNATQAPTQQLDQDNESQTD